MQVHAHTKMFISSNFNYVPSAKQVRESGDVRLALKYCRGRGWRERCRRRIVRCN